MLERTASDVIACGDAGSAMPHRLRVDRTGRVLACDGVPAAFDVLSAWFPGLDGPAFAALAAAARIAPGHAVSIDARSTSDHACSVCLRALPDTLDFELELDDTGADRDYRARLEQRLAFERLIASLSTELIHASARQVDALIEEGLGRIGRLFEVDRAYLFRFDDERTTHTNTHEWVEQGISREAMNLQALPVTTFPWLMRELFADRAVHVPFVEALPDAAVTERAEFMREGIRSLAIVPFGEPGRPDGFIGFDSVRRQRHWPVDIMLGLRLVAQMFANAFRAREMAERLIRLAFHDPLTGLGNRRYLAERLTVAIEHGCRDGRRLAVILIDLDDFKLVNDSYGHAVGDEVLKVAAARLADLTCVGDVVARLGGDEFVLVAESVDVATLSQRIERLFQTMAEPVELRGLSFPLRLSVGIALSPDDGDDAESLLRQADTAMYAAKVEGKNRFAFFTPGMTEASRESLRLRHELRLALERGEIRPHYQPRVALASGRVVGFEALARWQHPARGVLMPAQFLGLAQQSGAIGQIDVDGLAHALADLAGWRRTMPDCRVSVNLDAQALQDERLIARLEALLVEAGELASGVEIEITETSLMRDIEQASQVLARLRDAVPGLQVAIDDFGIGYSSLAYLGRLPVTTLKIDRSFIADLTGTNPRSARAIIRSILGLGRSLGLHVVAEGVETQEQADELCAMGCEEAQGYLFAAALEPESAARWLEHDCRHARAQSVFAG